MKRKKKYIKVLALIMIGGATTLWLLISPGCSKPAPVNPNLMTAGLTFQYPANAEKRMNRFLENETAKQILKREPVNSQYNPHPWFGRVRYSGISYHGLLAVDQSVIRIKQSGWDHSVRGLNFTVYNPNNSRLFYKVGLQTGKQTIYLYKGYFDKETLETKSIPLENPPDGPVEIVLETKGEGVGVWINPRLLISREKPRVFVVIVLDTLRADHLSLYGYSRQTSPVLDSWRREATVFRNAFSTTSWTLPAHVSLFSGKNLDQHTVMTPNDTIPAHVPLMAEMFQNNGYLTAAFTGGGFIDDNFGFARGFQLYSNIPGRVFDKDSAARVLNHFRSYVEQYWGSDMFIFLHTYQIHAPYKAPHEYIDQINPKIDVNLKGIRNFINQNSEYYKDISEQDRRLLIDLYDAAILYCDRVLVGGVEKFLKEKKIFDESMLVVLSDHGEEFFDHHSWEHGHSLYRELIQIPLVIKYPHSRKIGDEFALTSISDIAGIMLKESGLPYDAQAFPDQTGRKKRTLAALLPLSPIIPQFPPKISLMDERHHFIYNFWKPENEQFFNPEPPRRQEMELYESKDHVQMTDFSKRRHQVAEKFREELTRYLEGFRDVKMEKFRFSKELEERLKSLGYLGGK